MERNSWRSVAREALKLADERTADARARCAVLEAERDEARAYGEDMYRHSREITCVWCGHQFTSTLGEQRDELHKHAETCEQHPIHKLTVERANLERDVEDLRATLSFEQFQNGLLRARRTAPGILDLEVSDRIKVEDVHILLKECCCQLADVLARTAPDK